MGDARPADRRERASASRLPWPHRRRPQRHHRELPRAEACAHGGRAPVRHRDRHRSGRAPRREGAARRRAAGGGSPRAEADPRPLRAGPDLGRRPGHDRRGPQRPAGRDRPGPGRVLRRVRHPRHPRLTRATSCSSTTARWPSSRSPASRSRTSRAVRTEKQPQHVTWDPVMAEKAGYSHFMLKEIYEQPRAVRETVLGRTSAESGRVFLEEMQLDAADAARDRSHRHPRVRHLVARGAGRQVPDRGARAGAGRGRLQLGVPLPPSDRRRQDARRRHHAVGRDGRHAGALREAKRLGAPSIAICNVVGSMATREADGTVYTHAGPEIGVASTKAFTSQLVALHLLALALGPGARHAHDRRRRRRSSRELEQLPLRIEEALRLDGAIEALSAHRARASRFPLPRPRHQLSRSRSRAR